MSYITGSRTSQANPAEDLATLIGNELALHTNWELADEYIFNTTKYSVYRCLGAGNAMGVDYYVFLWRSTAAGSTALWVAAAETYDAVARKFGHPIPQPSSGTLTPAADGSYGGTTTYSPPEAQTALAEFQYEAFTTSTTAYDYRIAVNKDGCLLTCVTGGTLYGAMFGILESLVADPATNDPVPLFMASVKSTSNSSSVCYAATSRHPRVTTAQARLWGITSQNVAASTTAWPTIAMVGTVGGTGDLFQAGLPIGARMCARTWAFDVSGSSVQNTVGAVRGLYPNVLALVPSGAVVLGDTCTVGGQTYVFLGSGTQAWYNTSAA